ncbi:hypothetical protein GWK48_09415 [Metallosphaera tengchongensis]|uniref:ArsR family transcriptional regulator n=1 Tax=Metallosphaera tengchongensis TaxID=1532350 RepID=A0A6N0NWH6_9CREN|nr:hypothetical protein [Metallosphaera tengchongensis]QKR00567.1 hypothetical protein GWK48_09415 [Metallosphaera tengchongensis]
MPIKIDELPCSAKLVFKILEIRGKATFQELKTEARIPDRTLREALRILREAQLLDIEPCLSDARSKVYTLSGVCMSLKRG